MAELGLAAEQRRQPVISLSWFAGQQPVTVAGAQAAFLRDVTEPDHQPNHQPSKYPKKHFFLKLPVLYTDSTLAQSKLVLEPTVSSSLARTLIFFTNLIIMEFFIS